MHSRLAGSLFLALVALAGCDASESPSLVVTSGNGTFGRVATVPGLPEAFSAVTSLSCVTSGDCLAGGSSSDGAFVISEDNGRWGAVHLIHGTATIDSVSCASPGNCAASGTLQSRGTHSPAFVISETHGIWEAPVPVRGPARMGRSQNVDITSVSCGAPGSCSAGGALNDRGKRQPFVINDVGGTWGAVQELPGLVALNIGRDPSGTGISSISCTAAGDCSAAGTYASGFLIAQGFVVSEVDGTWGTAIEAPGSPAHSSAFGATMRSLSCASPGNCLAVENYERKVTIPVQPLLISQVDGTWGHATRVRGLAAIGGVSAELSAVSCGSAGNCTASGDYSNEKNYSDRWLFAVSEEHGTWQAATKIDVPMARTTRNGPGITSLSCDSGGNCVAGGLWGYSGFGTVSHYQAFVATKAGGRWSAAREIPGAAALNTAWDGRVLAVSCVPAGGGCVAGGYYSNHPQARKNHPYDQHAFLTSERMRGAAS